MPGLSVLTCLHGSVERVLAANLLVCKINNRKQIFCGTVGVLIHAAEGKAMTKYVIDDLPANPRASVRVARNDTEELYALAQGCVWRTARPLENLSDEKLVGLMLEPEFYAQCSGLERELIVRLAARLELESQCQC